MEFSFARKGDLTELMALYRAATQHMDARGVFQWDEIYPSAVIVSEDIARGQMQLGRIEGAIAVAFALETCARGEYEPAAWRYDESHFIVLHRLCVHPAFQGRGVARQAMDALEAETLARGIRTIRLDAFSQNPTALRLYESRGYEKAGEIQYRKGLFYLYEKKLAPLL